ncbi:phospho-N-acetylmuramoyl-pentapeptide-transferase [Methanobrevibacter sp. TMH8]|uniref:glycosyltransferase family 4 protein n=1 Tax=Methanobrevibacter sp. TMH8 TaxID=2848611 RepID=UPI001CCB21A5|nr:phospho-N-acetylmuramoyl-pentapeptide-transferase [Methanobrevibacter sp. TMH8]MBZ9571285.1 phospho-N-acetylmuramoyl-pentapeptide-transferase [Methanobrevibacter sp. TMH8]
MNYIDLLVLFIITFISSIAFTYYIRKILIGADISDNPIVSEHRHKAGTPTMGGIAFLFSVLFIVSIYFKNQYILITSLIMLTAGIAGLLDDLIGFKVKEYQKLIKNITDGPLTIGQLTLAPNEEARAATPEAKSVVDNLLSEKKLELLAELPIKNEMGEMEKIIGQLVIGIFLIVTGTITTLGGFSLGPFITLGGVAIGILAIPVIIIAIIGAINAINLIDGMDGLASGIIAIASIACGIFGFINNDYGVVSVFIVLAAISLGFLVFNRYPASIFMGDTGSFALGAGFATAVLVTNIPYFGVLSLAVPIGSVIVSLIHRAKIIRLPVEPLHHTLHYRGISEKKIVFIYWILTAVICLIGLLAEYYIFL